MTHSDIAALVTLRDSGLLDWLREKGAVHISIGNFSCAFSGPLMPDLPMAPEKDDEDDSEAPPRRRRSILDDPALNLPPLPTYRRPTPPEE